MRYFKDKEKKVHGYDETIPEFKPYIDKAIASGWREITGSWPPEEDETQTQTRLAAVLGSAVNDGAKQWGYASIESGISYVSSENPQYIAEARALSKWRDQMWAWGINALNEAKPGETAAEFLSDMPDFPQRPVV